MSWGRVGRRRVRVGWLWSEYYGERERNEVQVEFEEKGEGRCEYLKP